MSAPDAMPPANSDTPARPNWSEAARITLPDEAATDAFAARLAPLLGPGDTLLLSGALGAGKTHLARALIRSRLVSPDELVPSPSFTLVQTYDTPNGVEIWHADLYRLADGAEVSELGLEEALSDAICLIEWPDRLGRAWPATAVQLHLERMIDDARTAHLFSPEGSALTQRLLSAMRP